MSFHKERGRDSAEKRAPNNRLTIYDDAAPVTIGAIEVKLELLLDEISANVGVIEAQLNVLAAMVQARDSTSVVYALRRLKAHWRCLDLSARDLVAADAERLSALRQAAEASP